MTNGGFLCLKQDMTQMFLNDKMEAVTLLKFIDDQEVIRVKTLEKDSYNAIVVGAGKKEKNEKVSYKYIKEFRVENTEGYEAGKKLSIDELKDIEKITLKARTKGKGFQGVMKRHGFGGGRATHGSKFHRGPGSIGNMKPNRVNKNHPLPGHMGNVNVTVKNVNILSTHSLSDSDNVLIVKGSVPGSRNSLIKIYL